MDLANTDLCCNQPSRKKKLDDRTEALVILDSTPLQAPLEGLIQYPYLNITNKKHIAYMDVFVEDF